MSDLHFPQVRIVTPKPERNGGTLAALSRVEVDGQWWPVIAYVVDSGKSVSGFQSITLTFEADITIEHPAEPTSIARGGSGR